MAATGSSGILSSLVYVSNWVQVGDVNIDPLGHTWSLAIEEQFYLIWPAVLLVLRGRALQVAVIAILVASAVRLVATGPLEYFSTITRADAILLGCVLAMVRPKWPAWVAVGGIAALVSMSVLDLSHDLLIPVAMVATAAVIGGRFEPLGRLAPAGLRAYSLYLWNWPMTIMFGSIAFIAPLMTVVVGELSFRLLEAPFLHRGRFGRPQSGRCPDRPRTHLRHRRGPGHRQVVTFRQLLGLAAAAVLVIACGGVKDIPRPSFLAPQPACAAASDPTRLCIVVMGDSIGDGVPVQGDDRWWVKLEAALAKALPDRHVVVDDWAISGSRIELLKSMAPGQPGLDTYDLAIVAFHLLGHLYDLDPLGGDAPMSAS